MPTHAMPEHQRIWQHHNGNYYRVYDTTNVHTERPDEYPPSVSYRGQNGKRWSKPLPNFLEKMTLTKLKVMPIRVGEHVVFYERLPLRGVADLGENQAAELCDIVSLLSYLIALELDPGMPGLAKYLEERTRDVFDAEQTRMVVPNITSKGYSKGECYGGSMNIYRIVGTYLVVDFGATPIAGAFPPDFCVQVSRHYPDSKLAEAFKPVFQLKV